MALDGKTLKVCNCNRTMALDAKALAAALQSGVPLTIHTELCRREVGAFDAAIAGGGECIVACTQEAPLFAELNEGAGAKSELKFVNIRETGGWSAKGAAATPEDRGAARARRSARARAGAERFLPVERTPARHRTGRRGGAVGGAARRRARSQRARSRRRAAAICRSSAAIPSGRERSARSRAGSARSKSNGSRRTRSTSTSARAATPASAPVRKTRSTSPTRSTSTSARRIASASRPAARCTRSTSSAADRARRDRFDLVLDLSAEPVIKTPRKPQGYFAAGRDPLEQALAAAAARAARRRVREAAVLRLRRADLRPRPVRQGGLYEVHRRLLDRRDRLGRRQGQGRAAPLRGLRGLRDGLPVGRDDLRRARALPDLGARLKRLLAVYARAGGKDAAILFHNASRAAASWWRGSRGGARGCRRASSRSRCSILRRSASTRCSARSRTARARCSCSPGTPTPTSTERRSSARWGMRRRS